MRLFTCVELTNQNLVSALTAAQQRICRAGRPTRRDQLHVTLKFFGEVRNAEKASIIRRLHTLQVKRFNLSVRGLGVFPTPATPRVVWAGVDEQIQPLVNQIDRLFSLEPRYTPHATLCRLKNRSNHEVDHVKTCLREYTDVVFGEQRVDRVVLKRSRLTPRGAVHEDIEQVRLT